MAAEYKVLSPDDLKDLISEDRMFALDVLNGLSEAPKRLSSKYFYDDYGSKLFREIMALPEYYLTNCEREILENQRDELVPMLGAEKFNLIELGAGDGSKTSLLIESFLQHGLDFRYIPIDISEGAMRTLIAVMKERFPGLTISGLVAEYFDGLKWLSSITGQRNLVLFLGSNLGNFSIAQAKVFLRTLWSTLRQEDLLVIGFDLKKDIDLMLDAYNDSQGITAAFNLNLLQRINRQLGGEFDLKKFRFFATYNVFSGAIESYLVSQVHQEVFVERLGQSFSFKAWEPIHTEYSYKYLESDIADLAHATGYCIQKQLYDRRHFFVDSVWSVEKETK